MSHTIIQYEELKKVNKSFEALFKQKFSAFLKKGHYILGEELALFEQEFRQFHHADHVIGVANGLDALILSLKSCDFKKGDEVLVPSNTYIATILAILHCGLIPVFVEPNIQTYNIDTEKIEEKINDRTVAIIIVHLYGQSCEMDAILSIVNAKNLILIEDCAQAHGASYKGKLVGTFGHFGAFSFYPTKNLGALGDAGAVICKTDAHDERLRKLRNYGSRKKYYNGVVGYNSRLDELQASFLRVKLPYLEQINAHKKALADFYHAHLSNNYIKPKVAEGCDHVYHIFNIRHPERDRLKRYLLENGIVTEIHYPIPPHHQKALKEMAHLHYPISSEIHATTLSLPCSFAHHPDQILKVIEVLNSFK